MLKVDTTLNLPTIATAVALLGSAAVGLAVMRYDDKQVLNGLATEQMLLAAKVDTLAARFEQAKTDEKLFTSEMRTALSDLKTNLAVSNAIRSLQPGAKK